MRLDACERMALRLMREHELWGWTLEWYSRHSDFVGVTRHGAKLIRLSRPECFVNTRDQCRQVVLHEIAHALLGPGEGHGPAWVAKALEIGVRNPSPCVEADFLVVPPPRKRWSRASGRFVRE